MTDRSWYIPALVLTAVNAVLALTIFPKPETLLMTLTLFPLWMIGTLGGLGIVVFMKTIKLMKAGEEAPLTKLLAWVDVRLTLIVLFSMAIAGLNKIAFLWLKPALNVIVPFTADPLLADLDKRIFLGTDPWTLLSWANNDLSELIYHPIWYFTMIGALMVLFTHEPSARKSAMALSYFLLWSVVGPAIHSLVPAGGPIFYERLGYGDRFAGLDGGPETASAAAYLWQGFTSGQFEVASGISAMPSLHVTMAVWTMLCIWHFAQVVHPGHHLQLLCHYLVGLAWLALCGRRYRRWAVRLHAL